MAASGVGLGSVVDVGWVVEVGIGVGAAAGVVPPQAFKKSALNTNRKRILLIAAPRSLVGGIIGEKNSLYTLLARGIW
jgi:hypothetical protein